MTNQDIENILVAGVGAFIVFLAALIGREYMDRPIPYGALALALASSVSWAIGSTPAGPAWWNGSINIAAAWLASAAVAIGFAP